MNRNQIFWYRVILITAALLIIGAYINGFRFSKAVFIKEYRLATLLTVLSGICVAQGIKESAKSLFNTIDKLWFACFSGFTFVSFTLFLCTSMFVMLSAMIIDQSEKKALHPNQMKYLLPASTLLWLLLRASPGYMGFFWKVSITTWEPFSFSALKNYSTGSGKLEKTKALIHKSVNYVRQKSNHLMK